jgi:hypothetical protein
MGVAKTGLAAGAGDAVKKLSDGIAGLFGTSAADKARRAEVESYYTRALSGDGVAFRQLEFIAFEKRTGAPGDLRPVPKDRSASPPASREAAKKALRLLVAGGKTLSSDAYYAKLGVSAPRSAVQQFVGDVAGQVFDSARPVVRQEVQGSVNETLKRVVPLLVGAVVLAAVIGYAVRR